MNDPEQAERDEEWWTNRQAELLHADTDWRAGTGNVTRFGLDAHPVVFPISLFMIGLFLTGTILLGETAASAYEAVNTFINANFGWLYIFSANAFILALVSLAASRYGDITIGGLGAEPKYTTFEWMAMLFSAGMGIGLMFWSVAEPMYHLSTGGGTMFPFDPNSGEAARAALGITLFHWGIHPWAVYGLVALGLAFFAFNRGLPLTFRSMFYPLFGDRVFGWPGHVVDLVTVFATIFGLATSLGLGAAQINAGLSIVLDRTIGIGLPVGAGVQLVIIAAITAITGLSVWAGIDKGLKRLSTLNVYLMVLLMLFVLAVGPTRHLLESILSGVGFYVQNLPHMAFFTETFLGSLTEQAGKSEGWQAGWTVFYWGWWIAWSPFVGLFIARISRGRSIRQMVLGVLLLPTAFSMTWLGSFGGLAIFTELELGGTVQETVMQEGSAYAMFELLGAFPLSMVTSTVAVAVVVTFFVTSADSGSQVIGLVTAGGKLDVPRPQRMLWAIVVGIVAAALLVGGGLDALQTAAITTGLPFAVVILVMIYTLFKGLAREHAVLEAIETPSETPEAVMAAENTHVDTERAD
ncbi:MAG: BCCT family transporter [Halodesulfurarchaeum sp.]